MSMGSSSFMVGFLTLSFPLMALTLYYFVVTLWGIKICQKFLKDDTLLFAGYNFMLAFFCGYSLHTFGYLILETLKL